MKVIGTLTHVSCCFKVLLEILTGLPPYDEEREGHDLVCISYYCITIQLVLRTWNFLIMLYCMIYAGDSC